MLNYMAQYRPDLSICVKRCFPGAWRSQHKNDVVKLKRIIPYLSEAKIMHIKYKMAESTERGRCVQ